jgi:tetratricopeptide (TPR) repeat protein
VDNNNLKKWRLSGLVATVVIVLSIPAYLLKAEYFKQPLIKRSAEFVGSSECRACHTEAYDKWKGSHHDKAMDVAGERTILGDFNDAVFEYEGIKTRFFRKNEKFFVNAQGPDGEMGDFEVTHTFGVYPLQQYLVPFPGGRLQCLTIAWDSRDGKWFALPNHINDPDDWLHWTKNAQNWNGMCADCHSTNVETGYDHLSDTYNTTWSEIDVGCEACHGPGSLHVEWADRPAMARLPSDDYELVVDTADLDPGEQLRICAPCHSRRAALGDFSHTGKDLMDYVIPQLINEGLYYPDGQILDEVYVYGSFVQSKMYRSGVRCSDCHDIHSMKRIKEGNDLCLQCHRADTYNTKDHHFHKKTHMEKPSDGWLCERCHMPGRYYMGNDYRPDHSIRVPRPDLSVTYKTPNSCNMNMCHDDKTVQWSVEHYRNWYGKKRKPHYGTVIADGLQRKPEAETQLVKLANDRLFPPIVRATALSLLRSYPGEQSMNVMEQALRDDEPLMRHTAIRELGQTGSDRQVKLMVSLLYDPVKAVRMQAAMNLTALQREQLTDDQKRVFEEVLLEYQRSMEHSADFSHARLNLGIMYANLGKHKRAKEQYRKAIEIDDQFYPAMINLAMLYNETGNNSEAETLLREVLENHPEFYDLSYSLGLLLAEEKRLDEAALYLERAAKGMPDRAQVIYNYSLVLRHLGRNTDALSGMLRAYQIDPRNPAIVQALAIFYVQEKQLKTALKYARELVKLVPDAPGPEQMLKQIQQAMESEKKE